MKIENVKQYCDGLCLELEDFLIEGEKQKAYEKLCLYFEDSDVEELDESDVSNVVDEIEDLLVPEVKSYPRIHKVHKAVYDYMFDDIYPDWYDLNDWQEDVFCGVYDYATDHGMTEAELADAIIDYDCDAFEEVMIDGFGYSARLGISCFKYYKEDASSCDSDLLTDYIDYETGLVDWESYGEYIEDVMKMTCQFWIKGKSYFFVRWN